MGKPDALARLVLDSGAPEQIEHALDVLADRSRGRCRSISKRCGCPSLAARSLMRKGR